MSNNLDMKLPLLLLFLPLFGRTQILTGNDLLVGSVQLVSGASDGVRDHVLYHPNELFRQYPNLNKSFWDIRESWVNNRWAPFKDANHTFKTVTQTLDLGTVAMAMFEKKQTVKRAITKVVFAYLCRKAGFHLTYTLLFHNQISWH